ncbi:MAG TPA: CRISPR-associated endonuclease Cas1 [Terriglobales bacterium]|nr:CRISPR-associated endonuclease Cas1 [Terriglobales bacterium]
MQSSARSKTVSPPIPTTGAPLPAGSIRARELPEYLPARMVNEWVYCPRLFYYEWVEGLFAHSSDTVEGALRHEKLETKADPLPTPEEVAEGDALRSRSVELGSETYKLIAKMDLIEGADGVVSPVEYKRGSPRDTDAGPEAWPADRAQVCVQALILRDNGYRCDEAVIYYNMTKQRVRVAIDEALVNETLGAIDQAWAAARSGRIPPPLVDSPKCPRCSLVSICLPDETTMVASQPSRELQLSLFEDVYAQQEVIAVIGSGDPPIRRLVPARDDLRPLYVTGHGLTIGKSGEVLQVRDRKGVVTEARIGEICQVNLFGNVMLTAAALQGLCWSEKPIAHFSYGGWFYGLTQGMGLKNVFLRRAQFERADDAAFALGLARQLVASKVRNQRTMLQRNHVEPPRLALLRLKRMADDALAAERLDELLGIEGSAARIYFGEFAGMLKAKDTDPAARDDSEERLRFDFQGRNRRPPRDPVNALLSLAYSLLAKDLTIICHAVGFDPFIGYYHQPRFGRPALALDLMEGFRPLVADSTVLSAINTRMVTADDFQQVGPAVGLKPSGRKQFIRAYEQRMDALVTHPVFGYRVSYRRILEIQARLLGRVITGEVRDYVGFETR